MTPLRGPDPVRRLLSRLLPPGTPHLSECTPAPGRARGRICSTFPKWSSPTSSPGRSCLVCRSTPVGINAAKAAIHTLGKDAVDAVLVVADAPGKPVPAAVREQRVLAGAVPVVPVPWMPRLRAVAEISPALAGQLARPVQRVTKALLGAQSNKEKAE